uniref:MIP33401p1 n=1 Tax=Drosophila melanogaster TaxID=7227 RepID=H1UUE8_DROME|nr:MIP33401p1 [Drosophila melanogaster]AEX91746.1 MIP33405p1 [Drosophila melanogaster]
MSFRACPSPQVTPNSFQCGVRQLRRGRANPFCHGFRPDSPVYSVFRRRLRPAHHRGLPHFHPQCVCLCTPRG